MDTIKTLGGQFEDESGKWLVETIYDPEINKLSLAWNSPSGMLCLGDCVFIGGNKYIPVDTNPIIENQDVIFPSWLCDQFIPASSLKKLIKEYLEKFVLLFYQDEYGSVADFILHTWTYDFHDRCKYLYLVQPEQISATRDDMFRIGLICYRGMRHAETPHALINMSDQYRGTSMIPELGRKPDKSMFLGYNSGHIVWEVEVGKEAGRKIYSQKAFNVFCPKIICCRHLPDYAASDSFVIRLGSGGDLAETFKIVNNNKFESEAVEIRNALLRYRLQAYYFSEKVMA